MPQYLAPTGIILVNNWGFTTKTLLQENVDLCPPPGAFYPVPSPPELWKSLSALAGLQL